MTQDVLVSVETAKALKNAGYPQESAPSYYNVEDDCITTYAPLCVASGRNDVLDQEKRAKYRANYIAVPTYAEALRWLDGHGVYVCITVQLRNGCPYWEYSLRDINGVELSEILYSSREDAMNGAIINSVNKIKK